MKVSCDLVFHSDPLECVQTFHLIVHLVDHAIDFFF